MRVDQQYVRDFDASLARLRVAVAGRIIAKRGRFVRGKRRKDAKIASVDELTEVLLKRSKPKRPAGRIRRFIRRLFGR